MSNRERRPWENEKKAWLSQEEPEQIGSFKNSRWEIPVCSSRKLRVNGIAKVPAERSGLIRLLERSISNVPRFSLPPWATASVEVTDSSQFRITPVRWFLKDGNSDIIARWNEPVTCKIMQKLKDITTVMIRINMFFINTTSIYWHWSPLFLRGCASEGRYWGWGRPCSGWGRPHNVWNKAITDTYTGLWVCVCLQLSPWEPVLKQKATLTWFMAGLERSLKLCNAYADRVDPNRKKHI